ncbi:small integral membrane protein 15-like [Dama dama]|uniref:small integral membrane protein 15-like n=1 Tax=Dama dama TaxID=30532 RepID=UPI002A35DA82|nr:small integral membrane protein 15-like [Dama dama]
MGPKSQRLYTLIPKTKRGDCQGAAPAAQGAVGKTPDSRGPPAVGAPPVVARVQGQGMTELTDSSISPPQRCLILKAWAECVVEWAAKDPYGFLTTVILALTPLFLASAVQSRKLAKMIEPREKEQKKQKRQENIAKAKRLKKD